ncbi:MAG TPA: CHRD domain-containing protein [Chloroflexota bacterium]|nr:CHRD domain-containing protein [Chloroflexota bacterium]
MRKGFGPVAALLAVAVLVLAAQAQAPPLAFVAVMDAAQEVPTCLAAPAAAGGEAVLAVTDQAAGTVHYQLVANNLPDAPFAAHIHAAPRGVPGPIVQPLPLTPGAQSGVIGEGTFTNPSLVAALQADPAGYYVNVHTGLCPAGAIRGQLAARWRLYLPAVVRGPGSSP